MKSFRRTATLRLSIAVAIVAVATAALPAIASAVPGAVSVQSDTASVSGDGSGTATLTASAPVAGPGAVSQELVQSWDPSRLRLTGTTGIVAPSGWSLSYSSDGMTFGAAPGSPSGWAAIRALKATGSITSGGNSAGFQIVEGTGTGTVPPSATFSAAGGGDGWDVAFDDDGHVFNTWHHNGTSNSTPSIDCHTRSGASCGPGWPFALYSASAPAFTYNTQYQSMEWVDTVNSRIWIPTHSAARSPQTGFVCVDISDFTTGPVWCGGSAANAFAGVGTGSGTSVRQFAVSGTKLYTWEANTGRLLCLDASVDRSATQFGSPCANQPYSFGSSITEATDIRPYFTEGGTTLNAVGTKIFGSAGSWSGGGYAICIDPATDAPCSAWSAPVSLAAGATLQWATSLAAVPDANGDIELACFLHVNSTPNGVARGCFPADGTSTTTAPQPGFVTYYLTSHGISTAGQNPQTTGTRIYFSDSLWYWGGAGRDYCFDVATGAACANWPVAGGNYTVTVDTLNSNCIWRNTDSGAITTVDAITGGSTCVTPPAAATFSAPVLIPRLACSGAGAIRSWRTFQLTGPSAATYSGATLTVLSASGSVISGWNRLPITGASRTIDLSSLSVSTSGQAPQFRIVLANKTTNDPIEGTISAVGDAPQLCAPLVPQLVCPATASHHPTGPPTPTPNVITGTGTVQYASNPSETFTAGSATVAVTAPAAASCLGTIAGTATMASGGAAVPGAVVRLLDDSGGVVATTTTNASGGYAFSSLAAVSGYRVAFGTASQASISAATETAATTSRSVTANATTTVNGTYELLWTDPLSGSAAHGATVTVTPSPVTTAGVQSYAAFDRAQTCIVDPADSTCKARVTLPGEGTWSVDAGTGALAFAPAAGYSGTTTSVTYRVTETSTGRSVSSTAVAEIGPAPPVTATRAATPVTPASIQLTLRPSTRTIRVGQPIVVQVRVANTGDTTAQRVRACAVIPQGFVVNATGGGTISDGRVCYAVGAVTSAAPRTYSLTLTPSAGASQSTRFTGTATAMNAKKVRAAGKARPVRVVHVAPVAEPVTG